MADLTEKLEAPLLNEHPGDISMDRSEVDPNPAPQPESLRSKLMAHYQKGMKKSAPKAMSSPLAPETVDFIAVPMYLFTNLVGFYLGVFHMVPVVFEGDDLAKLTHRCFITVLCVEMMVNWLGIRYVDSTYSRYLRLYGPPKHNTDTAPSCSGNLLLNSGSTREINNSAAVLMPVITEGNSQSKGNHSSTHTKNGTSGHTSTMLIPAGAMIRQDSLDIKQEVELANKAMHRRNSQMFKRSIDDLLKDSDDKLLSPTSENAVPSTLPNLSFENDTDVASSKCDGVGNLSIPQTARLGSALTCPTPSITTNGEVMTKSYPYWSWVPCYTCGRARPPRCHHCPLCNTCVLKRDHHCYFAGACVGYRNHRFFYVFLIWAWSGAMYGTIYGGYYIIYHLFQEMSYVDILFPIALLRALLGYLQLHIALVITAVSFMVYFDGLAGLFIYAHTRLISWGVTSFEKVFLRKSLEIQDTRSLRPKIRSVFGPNWLICFLFPIHFFTEPCEDPVLWPDIHVLKS